MESYEPETYWSRRLATEPGLRGTGHQCYSEGYNRWLYRAKREVIRRALAGVPGGARALDIGSGGGWVVAEMRGHGLLVEGCDITPVAVEKLAAAFPDATFFQAAWGSGPLPRPDGHYDAVTLLDVAFHVVDDARWADGLADTARVLRPGGVLVATDSFGPTDAEPASHVRFRSEARWQRQARAVGLSLEAVQPCFRWLSRDHDRGWLRHLPDSARGAVEYGLERAVPRSPHMRCAVLRRRA